MSETNVKPFGKTSKGDTVLYTLKAGNYTASVTDFGACLVSFTITDAEHNTTDVVLGYKDAAGYEEGQDCLGEIVGRGANRTGKSCFVLSGITYNLQPNENDNNLHSGPDVFGKRIWKTEGLTDDGKRIVFSLYSPDGDQGYPGNMEMKVTYSLDEDGALEITYDAEADADTVCSPTNHTYFNLNGQGNGLIEDQIVMIAANAITPVSENMITDGTIMDVTGTPFDFRTPKAIGKDIHTESDRQLKIAGGYDHNYCLKQEKGNLEKAAEIVSPKTGIVMEVWTDLPGMQFYAGNFLRVQKGKDGVEYGPRSGFAMESQYYPNAINTPSFAAPVLKKGEKFHSVTVYKLGMNHCISPVRK